MKNIEITTAQAIQDLQELQQIEIFKTQTQLSSQAIQALLKTIQNGGN